MRLASIAPLLCALALDATPAAAEPPTAFRYEGLCDASAAVALDSEHFAVADDEHNTLYVYRRQQPVAVGSLPLQEVLDLRKESDLEGAATIGPLTFWIGSHGRNARGEPREDRQRLFATEVTPGSTPPALRVVGRDVRHLLDDLLRAPSLTAYDLAAASRRAAEAPGGLNIEGLAATPEGELLIGFRNPISAGGALVVPIRNPHELLAGAAAKVGMPLELPLGGRGIRSLERIGTGYVMVAGPPADDGSFALYRWSGHRGDAPVPWPVDLDTLRPEALFQFPGSEHIELLSDDGGVEVGGVACKTLPRAKRSFRSLTLRP